MSYKAICDTCKGNGYIYVTNTKGTTESKQCWMCESEGEISWSQAQVDDFIYNTYYRKRLHWVCSPYEWEFFGHQPELLR